MSIHKFLKQPDVWITDKANKNITHTSMVGGRYYIKDALMDQFWNLYCDECHDTRLCITERPQPSMPVLCDVDIKQETSGKTDVSVLYTEEMIMTLIQVYRDVLFEIIDELKEEDFLCCVLEKEPYFLEKNEKIFKKNGFHLHFPKIFLSRKVQEMELIPRILQEIKKKQVLKSIASEKCIDNSYCKGNGWLLYGSSKSSNPDDPTYYPYEVSYCVNHDLEKQNYKCALLSCNIYDTNRKKINFDESRLDYYLPRILSIWLSSRTEYEYHLREDVIPLTDMKNIRNRKPSSYQSISVMEDDDLFNLVERLMGLLSIERAKDHNEWMNVGWILYNVFDGSNQGFHFWNDFSKRCPDKYDHKTCMYEWNRMVKRNMTIASLKYLAFLDNAEEYGKLITEFMTPFIRKSIDLNGSHNDMAKALFQKYESQYVCSSIQYKIWHEFQDHIWKKLEEGITLRQKISEELVELHYALLQDIQTQHKQACVREDAKLEKKLMEKIKVIYSIMGKLKSAPYKNNIMREAQEVFYNEYFISHLDSNPYIVGFQNGVYDLQSHEFRDGRPSDMISLKMPISYRPDLSLSHPEVISVLDFFQKIFPDTLLRNFFINLASEIFVGGNQSKIVQVWTGEGDNGKSITQLLFEKMLGPYAIKLPTSLITGKRTQSSAACPELVRAGNGVRMATLQEPDQNDVINVGILKELSGNDTFFARGLYKDGQEMTPMFKLILICNEPPKLPHNDKATWNRIRVIPFESTFTDDAPETFEEQLQQKKFPKDKEFADKIPKMTEALAWLLLHTLKFRKKVLVEPQKVMSATNNYRKKNDIYRQFIEEWITKREDAYVEIKLLYECFKEWFRTSFPNQGYHMPNKMECKDYFTKLWGDPDGSKGWTGYALKSLEETENDFQGFGADIHHTNTNPIPL